MDYQKSFALVPTGYMTAAGLGGGWQVLDQLGIVFAMVGLVAVAALTIRMRFRADTAAVDA